MGPNIRMEAHELVDIVDEQDRVCFQTTRVDAHARGLLHRCVIALLINPRNEWVLVEQAGHLQDAGQLTYPVGGHVLAGERPEDALRREIDEETSITAFDARYMGKITFRRQILGRDENHLFMFHEIRSREQPRISVESVGFHAFTMDSLRVEISRNPRRFGDSFYASTRVFYPELLV